MNALSLVYRIRLFRGRSGTPSTPRTLSCCGLWPRTQGLCTSRESRRREALCRPGTSATCRTSETSTRDAATEDLFALVSRGNPFSDVARVCRAAVVFRSLLVAAQVCLICRLTALNRTRNQICFLYVSRAESSDKGKETRLGLWALTIPVRIVVCLASM